MISKWWLWRFWMTNFVLTKKMPNCKNVKFLKHLKWHPDNKIKQPRCVGWCMRWWLWRSLSVFEHGEGRQNEYAVSVNFINLWSSHTTGLLKILKTTFLWDALYTIHTNRNTALKSHFYLCIGKQWETFYDFLKLNKFVWESSQVFWYQC